MRAVDDKLYLGVCRATEEELETTQVRKMLGKLLTIQQVAGTEGELSHPWIQVGDFIGSHRQPLQLGRNELGSHAAWLLNHLY